MQNQLQDVEYETEHTICLPDRSTAKQYNFMSFNASSNVDLKMWKSATMEREKDSESDKQRKSEVQPWLLEVQQKQNSEAGYVRKYRGRRTDRTRLAPYYIFILTPSGTIEAFPIKEWYSFERIPRYKPLSADEAEEEFAKKERTYNYFNLMLKKRLRGDEEAEVDEDDTRRRRIDQRAKNRRNARDKKVGRKSSSEEEAFEESDDGDLECREIGYISDSSESDSELERNKNTELKSVADELMSSSESSEDEEDMAVVGDIGEHNEKDESGEKKNETDTFKRRKMSESRNDSSTSSPPAKQIKINSVSQPYSPTNPRRNAYQRQPS